MLILAVAVCVLIGPVFAAGVDVTTTSAVAALVLVLGCLARARSCCRGGSCLGS